MLVVSLEANLETFHGVWEQRLVCQWQLKLRRTLERPVLA